MIRRKDFEELKITSAQREKELKDKFDRVTATNNRLKANNERLQSELSELKKDNQLLTEKMNAVLRIVFILLLSTSYKSETRHHSGASRPEDFAFPHSDSAGIFVEPSTIQRLLFGHSRDDHAN